MNRDLVFNQNICLRAEDYHKGRGHSLFFVVFLFPGVSFLQGVLHSSSLPDYIEDKKSGGQKTDWLINKSLCNDPTIIIGREARKGRMLKTVIYP
jgi:hypothetical protein